jgi:hypothetical protein
LTERGYAVARNIRQTVRQIEREWKRELGPAQFERLQQLLLELNDTKLVRDQR